ncbi:hypothetical protein lam_432 [Candidatus Liberibacter americanus str. Sao Paulo]|uniref:Uncharacterized protein n=1 Tax=Candidatus Liberibacter americanus str. Sao Paulo TaxID=1261131 RepID=U6B413_9HYPH|nr:hypothetical protein lam_432 [Candidatus Liberibacter americanus str. Sao Paulo]
MFYQYHFPFTLPFIFFSSLLDSSFILFILSCLFPVYKTSLLMNVSSSPVKLSVVITIGLSLIILFSIVLITLCLFLFF